MTLLAIDLGTSACKAAVFSLDGKMLALASREYFANTFSSELDCENVWKMVKEVITQSVAECKRSAEITALSISSMGEAAVPVTNDRKIVGRSILCMDPRGMPYSDKLEKDFGQREFYKINPNLLAPNFTMPIILWYRDHEPKAFAKAEKFLLWADFVGFMLGAEPYATNSMANRTLLFDLEKNDWSDRLLQWSGLDRSLFGRIVPGGTVMGEVSSAMAAELGLPKHVAIVAGGHDQCCNSLGCGVVRPGMAVAGLGTFETYCPAYSKPSDTLRLLDLRMNIEHHVLPDLYVSFLYNQSGTALKWYRDAFAVADRPASGEDLYTMLNKELPDEPSKLMVLPHFAPLQWPIYDAECSGLIMGLKGDTKRGEVFKAIMEGTTLYFADSLSGLREVGIEVNAFHASGGGSRSDALLQTKADILNVPFVRMKIPEGSLAGAAMLAGLSTKQFASPDEAVSAFVKRDRVFEPNQDFRGIYQEKTAIYRDLAKAIQPVASRLSRSTRGEQS